MRAPDSWLLECYRIPSHQSIRLVFRIDTVTNGPLWIVPIQLMLNPPYRNYFEPRSLTPKLLPSPCIHIYNSPNMVSCRSIVLTRLVLPFYCGCPFSETLMHPLTTWPLQNSPPGCHSLMSCEFSLLLSNCRSPAHKISKIRLFSN